MSLYRSPLFFLLLLSLTACFQAPHTQLPPQLPTLGTFSDEMLDSAPLAAQAVLEALELQELEAFELLSETDALEADLDSSSLSGATGYLAYIEHLPADANPWRVMLNNLTEEQTHTLYSGTQEVQSVAVTTDGTVLMTRQIPAGSFQVFRLNPDGSALRLTQGAQNRFNVSVSADGNTIAWEGVTVAGRRGFYLRRSGSSSDTFFGLAAGAQREPSLSNNGHYLAFVRETTAAEQLVMLYDLRRNLYQPVFRSANAQLSHPHISDNLRVVYLQQQEGEMLLRLTDLYNRSTVNVVRGTNVLEHPTITADGAFVGYSLQNATQSHLILREVGSNSGTRTVTLRLPNRTLGMVWQKTAANLDPEAMDDSFTTDEDTVLSGNVILNSNPNGADRDPNGDILTVVAADGSSDNIGTPFSTAKGAIVTLNSDGSLLYDPNGSFDSLNDGETDTDSFSYTLSDGEGGSATATVTITISGVTPPPSLPVISNFSAEPSTINQGQSSTLSWTVTGATSLSISTVGDVTGSESTSVSPISTTTYTLTATNDAGSVEAQVTVTVLLLETTRVSVSSDGVQGDGSSDGRSSISADGRYIAFQSAASTLVSGDSNGTWDVFVHDRQTSSTTLVSVSSTGTQGNGHSLNASISADGRYVAFQSLASTLVSGDSNDTWDIFVHDRQTSSTTLVSVSSTGTQGNGLSFNASISADGRYVAFQSVASNLVSGDSNSQQDVFVHDRQTSTTTRVSVASTGTQGNGNSRNPSISADGRYVAFQSLASTLVSGDSNVSQDVFVHDRQTSTTTLVSVSSTGTQGNGGSESPSISADGRYVAFHSTANDLVSGDSNGTTDVFVHDRQTSTTTLVSISSTGTQGNSSSRNSSISADGRYVAFQSLASTLVSGDSNGTTDVFVYDRQTSSTTRVSVSSTGTQGNISSENPSISADGRYVGFTSLASNLVSGDSNNTWDIFVRNLE